MSTTQLFKVASPYQRAPLSSTSTFSQQRTLITCTAVNSKQHQQPSRREAFTQLTVGLLSGLAVTQQATFPAFADDDEEKSLCNADCIAKLAQSEKQTTPSGLQYQDIVVGTGASAPIGYQVVLNYVAMTPQGRVFDSSLQRGSPYDIRVGAGQVIAGLDEGLKTMKSGGIRRLYIPGELAFPNGLPSGPGRPRVPPMSPVVFDVQLLYVPGVDDE